MLYRVAASLVLLAVAAGCATDASPEASAAGSASEAAASLAPLLGSWCVEGVVVGLDGKETAATGRAEVETASRGGAQIERLRLRIGDEPVESWTMRSWNAERGRFRYGVLRGASGELVVLEGGGGGRRWELDSLRFDDSVRTGARTIHTRLVESLDGAGRRLRRDFYGSADVGGTWAPSGWLEYRRATDRGCDAEPPS
jgi:hypothetical protein